jgi:hypothetical protein
MNNFITTLLGIFPHEIWKKRAFFTLELGPIFCPKNAVGKSLFLTLIMGIKPEITINIYF